MKSNNILYPDESGVFELGRYGWFDRGLDKVRATLRAMSQAISETALEVRRIERERKRGES